MLERTCWIEEVVYPWKFFRKKDEASLKVQDRPPYERGSSKREKEVPWVVRPMNKAAAIGCEIVCSSFRDNLWKSLVSI